MDEGACMGRPRGPLELSVLALAVVFSLRKLIRNSIIAREREAGENGACSRRRTLFERPKGSASNISLSIHVTFDAPPRL